MYLRELISELINLEHELGPAANVLNADFSVVLYNQKTTSTFKREDQQLYENILSKYALGSEFRKILENDNHPHTLPAYCWGSQENIQKFCDDQYGMAKETLSMIEESTLAVNFKVNYDD